MKALMVISVFVMIGGLIGAILCIAAASSASYFDIVDPSLPICAAIYWLMFALGLIGLGLAVGLPGLVAKKE